MRKSIFVSGAIAVALMGGCATVPNIARNDTIDVARIAAIENAAKVSGVTVKWINYPQKKDRSVGLAPAMPQATGT